MQDKENTPNAQKAQRTQIYQQAGAKRCQSLLGYAFEAILSVFFV